MVRGGAGGPRVGPLGSKVTPQPLPLLHKGPPGSKVTPQELIEFLLGGKVKAHNNTFVLLNHLVKVHRVLSSHKQTFASAQRIQFHRFHTRDSRGVVTPFMHDTN